MRKKIISKDSLVLVFGGITAVGTLMPFAECFTGIWPMGNITLSDLLYLFFLFGYFGSIIYLISRAAFSFIQAMRPVNRFKQLYSEIEREWQNTNNDDENYPPGTERTPGDKYRDRERLNLKLKKLRVYAPHPQCQKHWTSFIEELCPLSREGMLGETRRRYGDPEKFHEPSD